MHKVKGFKTISVDCCRITNDVTLTQSESSQITFPAYIWEELKKQIQAEMEARGATK